MAALFNMASDQIINHDGKVPKEIVIVDKTAIDKMRLIQQLDVEDRQTIFKLIEKTVKSLKTSSLRTWQLELLHNKAWLN